MLALIKAVFDKPRPFALQVGGTYVNRLGQQRTIVSTTTLNHRGAMQGYDFIDDQGDYYTAGGSFLIKMSEHRNDLIERVA